ncbi:MAG: fasciclin domain-containing protein [Prevotella sp.]|nr:fasciclin domain-containing protein [Prevotella sp.]
MTTYKSLLTVLSMIVCMLFVSCRDIADDDHYAPPSWLKGNAWQVLESEGDYSTFLKAIELTGYQPIVNGQSILTVMAPNNEAWQAFLQKEGYSTVEDMYAKDPTQLKKTVGFHLMYYAYDWAKMLNFRPDEGDGATEEQKQNGAGLYYKHRTRSADAMEQVRGKLNGVDTTVTVYHYERYLPVFSHLMFSSLGVDAKTNYEYFFPGSQWTGGSNGFNVANASVTDQDAVVTDNGYLYHVNQVIRPMETIYTTLKNNANYSNFVSLYDTYAELTEADQETNTTLGKVVYTITHGALPNIACEWPVTNFRMMSTLERSTYTIFAPSNQAIAKFFTNYWKPEGGYHSLSDLDPLILQYFIMQSFADNDTPVFPEDVEKGRVQTAYGTPINIETNKVDDRLFCENGIVYGMNDMEAPAIFSSVVGPAFRDTTYQCFMYALDKSDLVLSLASNKSTFVTLMPSNLQFNRNEPQMRLNTTTQGRDLEVYSDVDGNFANMSAGQARSIVNMHTASNVSELSTTGIQVVETNTAFNYWFVHDGKITTSALFNQQLSPDYQDSPFVSFREIPSEGTGTSWANGRAYAYDYPQLFAEASGDGLTHRLAVGNDRNYEYYLFAQLLQKAGLVANGGMPSITSDDTRYIVFVPTNEAIRDHIAEIPGCSALNVADDFTITGNVSATNKTLLANYLRNYFVSSLMNTISSYPYPGSTCKGQFLTMGGEHLTINENATGLSAGLSSDNMVGVVQKYFGLPFAFADGCMHFIDGILK